MQQGITFLTTRSAGIASMGCMANSTKGIRGTTPTEFRALLAARIIAGREKIGYTVTKMATELSVRIGREIRPDTYRKWETIESTIAVDAIVPFCDLTRTHVLELLHPNRADTDSAQEVRAVQKRGKAVA